MRTLRTSLALTLLATLAACAPRERIKTYDQAPPLASSCTPRWYPEKPPMPKGSQLLAELRYGDTGLSVNCSQPEIREKVRAHACAYGADAVRVVAESREWKHTSSCYKIIAELYRLPADSPATP